ncbi:TBC1 domain family member 2A [Acipenser ruthenus]|uniref:TBC1 domain family member 2A n=1 Tax=Acipenser ruthenus TaxID=7906 RepID=A0A444UGA1_ACIRT|nr:TBC1 domain family member 2A [Acipenser ruthenus]
MEQDCQVRKPRPAAQSSDPNVTSPHNHHDLTASAKEEVGRTKENGVDSRHTDQSNTQEKPVMKTEVETSTKLCGYLNKLGGPLKAWKARWFVFEEKKCQLYYYRMSQDANPLGSIDLANATFGYPAEAEEGTFEIQIPGRVVVLKALNSQAMLYWLQQLQMKRWQHNTSLVKIPAEPSTTSTQPCQLPSAPEEERTEDFLPAIKTPKGLVGEAAAYLPDPWQQNALQKLSLKHPITEIQNTVLNICGNKPAQELRRSVFNFDEIRQPLDSPCEDPVTLGETTVPLAPIAPTVLSAPSVSSVTNGPAQEARTGGKNSPSSSMKKREKKMTSSLQPSGENVSGKEGSSVDKRSRLQHEVFTLTEELKSQKCAYLEAKNCQIESKYLIVLRSLQDSKGLDSSQQEMCAYLEAKNCQIESKYLIVLRSLQDSKGLDSSQQEMVKRLIEDSLQGDVKDVLKLNPVRLAAIALLVLKDEEDAFWCLVAVVEIIMPRDYYSKTLTASQADQRVFRDFLAEKMPRLTAHFKEHSIDHSLITFNWFLVVFVESLVSDILLRVWDAFLYEGTKVIFRYALALFKYKEEDILKIHDNLEIYLYLRFFTKTISDGRKLMNIAFNDMNPFPMKLLKNRREFHMERLTAELQELERIQEEFVKEQQVERKDKDLDTAVSEDEEEID